jgi:hypothetical protein
MGFVMVLALGLSAAWGQDSASQQEPATAPESSQPQQPVPANGPDNPVPPIIENPPISGLDLPNLEPHAAPLSYLQLGGHASESIDSNVEDNLGGSGTHSVSFALGSVDLQHLWKNYDLALDYLGGVGYYNARGIGLKQIEELGLDQRITWKRGKLEIRDAFSYQPEGTFGSAYGAVGLTGAGLSSTGLLGFTGGTVFGALGQVPRIMNLSVVDAVENLTPKSSITITGGYGLVHFLDNEPGTRNSFIGSNEVSGEAGYNRVLGRHDQGAIVYAYQGFQFSTGTNFYSHIIQLMWGHRITGRMDFLVGAGPQFTQINHLLLPATASQNPTVPPCVFAATSQGNPELVCPQNDLRISAAGRAVLRYRFPKTSLDLTYAHYITSGSGFFAGAESDIVQLSASRPLTRVWSLGSDIGFSRNSRVLPITCPATSTATCPGVSANIYEYGFAGVSFHRKFGRTLHAFASYQFNYLAFDDSYCQGFNGPCNRIAQRSVGTIGVDWTPRPIRLD